MRTLSASQKFKVTPAGRIPVDWQCHRLGEVAHVQTGLSKSAARKGDMVQLPYLRVANVQDGHLDLSEVKMISVPRSAVDRFSLRSGDVVLTEGGDHDKLGRGFVWHGQISPCVHQNHIFAVRPHPQSLNADFLALLTQSDYGRTYFMLCAKRTTNLASINSSQLKSFPLPLPEYDEQERIARFFAEVDSGVKNLDRLVEAHLERKRGLMNQLFTGKRGFAKDVSWTTVSLGDVFRERVEVGFNELPLLAITSDRGVVLRDDLVKRDTSNPDKSKYLRILPGDIGYNTMRMWQGVSAFSSLEGIVSPAYTVVTPTDKIDGLFASYLFKYSPVIHIFWRYSQGIVDDTLNLKFAAFSKIKIRIPDSIAEQRRIASIMKSSDRGIALLEEQAGVLREQKRGLMQKLLTGQVRLRAA